MQRKIERIFINLSLNVCSIWRSQCLRASLDLCLTFDKQQEWNDSKNDASVNNAA